VLQELLHLYLARHAWNDGRTVVADFLVLMQGRLEPVLPGDLEEATRLADDHRDIASRDLVHAALMRRLGATRIISADADFDRIAGIERLDPAQLAAWRATIAD
jgi:predicted nucleic acid-binding protein